MLLPWPLSYALDFGTYRRQEHDTCRHSDKVEVARRLRRYQKPRGRPEVEDRISINPKARKALSRTTPTASFLAPLTRLSP
jgi:hypothetical protein